MSPGPKPPSPLVEPVPDTVTLTNTEIAPRWKVIFHNDEVTTFEFVIAVIVRFFGHSLSTARGLTEEIHLTGSAVIAVLAYEEAEFRQEQVTSVARGLGFPLTVTIEPDA